MLSPDPPHSIRKSLLTGRRRASTISPPGRVFVSNLVGLSLSNFSIIAAHFRSEAREKDLKRERNAPSVEVERAKLKEDIMKLTHKRVGIVTGYTVRAPSLPIVAKDPDYR